MGQDNQAKHRQKARDLTRRAARRAPYKRMLIVCEGQKTEPHYFGELCQEYRLATANVQIWPSSLGTEPLQVVEYAERLFMEGDLNKGILQGAFDHVCAVFDRDNHATYHQALNKANALNGTIRNDLDELITFQAIASVPCFELWLLLHFENVHAPIHRNTVYARLNPHLGGYNKGHSGYWKATRDRLDQAVGRAKTRAAATNAYDGNEPYTDVHQLVSLLTHLKD